MGRPAGTHPIWSSAPFAHSTLTHVPSNPGKGCWHRGPSKQVCLSHSPLLRWLGREGSWPWRKTCSQRVHHQGMKSGLVLINPKPIVQVQWKGRMSIILPCTSEQVGGEKPMMTQRRDTEKDLCQNPIVRTSVDQPAFTQLSQTMSLLIAQLLPLLEM